MDVVRYPARIVFHISDHECLLAVPLLRRNALVSRVGSIFFVLFVAKRTLTGPASTHLRHLRHLGTRIPRRLPSISGPNTGQK